MIKVDDRVMLNQRHAARITKHRQQGRHSTDWVNRRGIVKHISKRGEVHVKWDDRVSVDLWPIGVIERAES